MYVRFIYRHFTLSTLIIPISILSPNDEYRRKQLLFHFNRLSNGFDSPRRISEYGRNVIMCNIDVCIDRWCLYTRVFPRVRASKSRRCASRGDRVFQSVTTNARVPDFHPREHSPT